MTFLILKWVHLLSAVLLFGAGMASAFYLWSANRAGNRHVIRFTLKNVLLADWMFTIPAIVLLPVTGVWMMNIKGYNFTDLWIWLSLTLFVIAGLSWMAASVLQYWMKSHADRTPENESLPAPYWKCKRLWFRLGLVAFPAVVAVFYLMVFKPL